MARSWVGHFGEAWYARRTQFHGAGNDLYIVAERDLVNFPDDGGKILRSRFTLELSLHIDDAVRCSRIQPRHPFQLAKNALRFKTFFGYPQSQLLNFTYAMYCPRA